MKKIICMLASMIIATLTLTTTACNIRLEIPQTIKPLSTAINENELGNFDVTSSSGKPSIMQIRKRLKEKNQNIILSAIVIETENIGEDRAYILGDGFTYSGRVQVLYEVTIRIVSIIDSIIVANTGQ